jgi:A/G-specific adenine glycosylase
VRSGPPPELETEHVRAVQQALIAWYAQHGRDLPWRRTRDAYAILVAEVMLQQTQVDRVVPRWLHWLEQFPTLNDLAAASRADVIRAWRGLGYNLRAVRLHEIAHEVVAHHGGELPRALDGLLKLPGVGRYTAGAIACFAYEQPVSMVDTNVQRVLGRVFLVDADRVRIQCVADRVLPAADAYSWNQALMDLGATLCRAERPLCLVCPLLRECHAARLGVEGEVRARKPRQPSFKGSTRFHRGRIIDAVRQRSSVDPRALATELHVDLEVLEKLIEGLVRDGLLRRFDDAIQLA